VTTRRASIFMSITSSPNT